MGISKSALRLKRNFTFLNLARAKSEALYSIYSFFKQNIKSCNAKRRRQRRRTVKNNNRSNSHSQLCTCITLFLYISLPLFCTTTPRNFQKLLSYKFYGRNFVYVLLFTFFHCRLFSPCIHRRYKIFILFFQQKNVSFVFYISL